MNETVSPRPKARIEILIAEDSVTQRVQLQRLLEDHGYVVAAARNGIEALAAARQRRPALIVSDVVMPELDGYGLCKAVKSDEALKEVPVILVTTLSDPRDVIRGLECGTDSFIRKPVDERFLFSRIDYLLMNQEMRANQKMQMGIEIKLGGQKHFITAERQQVLDLLISTYEQAVQLNGEVQQQRDALAQLNQKLDQANRLKSDFLATMSHELRTPLNAIIGFSEALRDGLCGDLTAEQKEFVGDIFSSGVHLLALINDILDLSKIEAGMMSLEAESVKLGEALQGALTIVKERAARNRLELRLDVEPGLEEIEADPRKLKQILYNLLSNAVKFTPEGGSVRLSARRVGREAVRLQDGAPGRLLPLASEGDGEYLEIVAADTGVGIPADKLGQLFQPFVQVDSASDRREGGTGLGLSLIRRLAELHDGTVGVSSQPGRGSRFSVWIPWREPKAETRPEASGIAAAAARPDAASREVPGEPLALVIEDDDHAAELIAARLVREGFRTIRAATAEEGLVRARKARPQLITLDVFLPHADGWEFMERLKGSPEIADTPVVIVSIARDLEHGLALGARRVLQKPFSAAELAHALSGIVPARANGARQSVLMVDDNPTAVDLFATQLEAAGFAVLRAYRGEEAVHCARRDRPALILLDLMMTGMNGFEVIDALKRDPETARIPILVVTAKDLSADERRELNGKVLHVVGKGQCSGEDFITEVRRALGASAATSEA